MHVIGQSDVTGVKGAMARMSATCCASEGTCQSWQQYGRRESRGAESVRERTRMFGSAQWYALESVGTRRLQANPSARH